MVRMDQVRGIPRHRALSDDHPTPGSVQDDVGAVLLLSLTPAPTPNGPKYPTIGYIEVRN